MLDTKIPGLRHIQLHHKIQHLYLPCSRPLTVQELEVHFMCPLDWAMGCPDVWSNLAWVFWMQLTFESVAWVKPVASLNTVGLV